MAGKFIKGALVEFMPTFLTPVPNVIIFQYNPETMVHTWTQPAGETTPGKRYESNPLGVKGVPGESFSFNIMMDANDMLADGSPVAQSLALAHGISSRLAALEMLQFPIDAFPTSTNLFHTLSSGNNGGGNSNSGKQTIPQSQVPVALFVWGPDRIVPVRVTNLTITEKLYDSLLHPIQAEAQLGLQVLTPEELNSLSDKDYLKRVAQVAYVYSQGLRQSLAVENLSNANESIIGMLPS